jgi:baculoviral IAP repeat-containing protein 6
MLEASYEEEMKKLQFAYVELTDFALQKPQEVIHKRVTRTLTKEHEQLAAALPCSASATIFLYVDMDCFYCMKALVSGPIGTPYANGLFEFDVVLKADYPSSAPLVKFRTTDHGRVRFNPNLYHCGKVCLSLLGTWSGEGQWNPRKSTLLQLLVSLQSLVLVPRPYFNEPGTGTPGISLEYSHLVDSSASLQYNKMVRRETLRVAMIKMLNNRSHIFHNVIQAHFKHKKTELLQQIKEWSLLDPQLKQDCSQFEAMLNTLQN